MRLTVKILHVAPSVGKSYGGPTYSLWGYVRAALGAGCTVTVLAPRPAPGDESAVPAGATLETFPARGGGAFVVAPALWRWLRDHGAEYDVIHVHGLFNPVSTLASRICVRRGWPLVIRPFGTLSRFTFTHRRGTLKRLWFRVLERANIARAGAVHFTTEGERDNAAFLGLELRDRAHVVPPPWIAPGHRDKTRHAGPPTVLLLGRLHPVKAVESVLAAWPLVLDVVPDARLVIAGDGDADYVSRVHGLAGPLERTGSVRFTGFVEGHAKQRLFSDATVFVLPSHHENFGIAVLEAIANGLPVVISPEVQLAPFVAEHALGVIAPREPRALAAAIAGALGDAPLQERCRTRGAGIVERCFSTESVGARLLTMYDAARDPATR